MNKPGTTCRFWEDMRSERLAYQAKNFRVVEHPRHQILITDTPGIQCVISPEYGNKSQSSELLISFKGELSFLLQNVELVEQDDLVKIALQINLQARQVNPDIVCAVVGQAISFTFRFGKQKQPFGSYQLSADALKELKVKSNKKYKK